MLKPKRKLLNGRRKL